MKLQDIRVELKTIKLSKSIIKQMEYIGIPKPSNIDVLGWVNMDGNRWVIIKISDFFYRGEFIKEIQKSVNPTQFPSPNGGWEYPELTSTACYTFNGRSINFSPERNEGANLSLYEHLVSYKRKTESAGQLYY